MNKILLAAPVSEHKQYILPQWCEYIKQLTYPVDILLIDNSKDKKYHKKLAKQTGIDIAYHRPEGKPLRQIMCECLEIIRRYAVRENYDYLFSLECDIFPPLNVLPALLAHRKNIVSASYFIDFGVNIHLMAQFMEKIYFNRWSVNCGQLKGFQFVNGKLRTCEGFGLGCSLIHKSILQRVIFHLYNEYDSFTDSAFHDDLRRLGQNGYIDTSIFCIHYNKPWSTIINKENVYGNN